MALTKVTGHVVKPDTNIQFHNTKSTGIVTFAHTDNATSSTTGALQVTGGVGIVKDLFVGGQLSVGGTITYEDVDNIKRFATSGVGATVFGELDVTGPADIEGNLTVGVGGTTITTVVGAAASVGIGDASPSYMLDVAGAINSQTDVKVNGVSVTEQALNDAVAMAIALG